MAQMVSAELANKIRFTPLATVNRDLVGRPGNTIAFPAWAFIGAAEDVAEGTAIPLDQMSTSEREVTVKKAGKGVELTDEAVLSGLGDPIGEANKQLALAIASKVDSDLIEAALGASQSVALEGGLDVAQLQAGLDLFDDEDQEPVALLINPADAGALRLDAHELGAFGSDVGANAFIAGTYGDILGVSIIRSRNVEEGNAVLVKQGALALAMKRDVQIEADRDIIKKTTVITADEHYAAYLYNDKKVVKFTTE